MKLVQSDCLTGMLELPEESVDLVYLDPPFYTQKTQCGTSRNGKQYAFDDSWSSRNEYLSYMRERLLGIRRVLKSTGSVYLHCDTSSSHYLRILMDEVFGENNFRSEIIWSYKRWSNSSKGLLPGHQTIFYYTKSNVYAFNVEYKDYSPTTNVDQIMQMRERNLFGKAAYKRDDSGEIVQALEKHGVPLSDVWEIRFLNPKAKERTGYPTQKPIELLERIIRLSSIEGNVVLDPFCGSGTTLVAAKLLNRDYIGFDISADAINIAQSRLDAPFKTNSHLLEKGVESYSTKSAEELAILNQFDCNIVQRNKGIDAILKKHYLNAPVSIKIQKPSESIDTAVMLLKYASEKRKCSFCVLIRTDNYSTHGNFSFPENMIVLTPWAMHIEQEIERRCHNNKLRSVCSSQLGTGAST